MSPKKLHVYTYTSCIYLHSIDAYQMFWQKNGILFYYNGYVCIHSRLIFICLPCLDKKRYSALDTSYYVIICYEVFGTSKHDGVLYVSGGRSRRKGIHYCCMYVVHVEYTFAFSVQILPMGLDNKRYSVGTGLSYEVLRETMASPSTRQYVQKPKKRFTRRA